MSEFVDAIEVVADSASVVGPTASQLISVSAPSGKKVLGGGFYDPNSNVVVRQSYPSSDGLTWNFEVYTNASGTHSVTAFATCLG